MSILIAIFKFIFLNLIAGANTYLLFKKFFLNKGRTYLLLTASVLFYAQIVFILTLLGILGLLYFVNIAFFECLVLMVLLLWKKNNLPVDDGALKETSESFHFDKPLFFCFAIILGFALVKAGINLINPPFGWDNLNYHFTFPVEWLKQANLDTPIVVSDDPAPTYYPINGSLLFFWFILPFKSVFLADLLSLPFFIFNAAAIYAISGWLGVSKKLSYSCAFLFVLIPNFFKQLEIAYVDTMVCALYLISVYFLLKLSDEFRFKFLGLAGISVGLLIGIKSLALVYALPLFIPVIYLCLLNIKKRGVSYLITFIFLVLLLGGFAYIRNFVQTGNPLYPVDIEILGRVIFRGVIDKASYSAHVIASDYNISKLLFHEGLGIQASLFVLPGILLAFPLLLIFRKRKEVPLIMYFLSVLPFILYLIWRYIIPLANTRYLYPALALSMIMGFYCAGLLKISLKFITPLVVICSLASVFELSGRAELIISLVLSAILFLLLSKGWLKINFIVIPLLLFMICLPFIIKDYTKNEYIRYKNTPFWKDAISAWIWLNDRTQGDNISYVGRPVPFPLYGSGFKNNVYYTSVNSVDPAKLHYFKQSRYVWGYDFEDCHKNYESENNYRGKADYQTWLTNLRKRKTDYLFIYSLHQINGIRFPLEDQWANFNQGIFKPLFINDTIHIYKLQ